jgi:hypothetical protein
LIGEWIERNDQVVGGVDQGSILLIVYSAFSEAVDQGQASGSALAGLLVANGVLLAAALITTGLVSKMAGLRTRRPGDHHLLRLEEEPVAGRHNGQGDLRFARRWRGHPASYAVPSVITWSDQVDLKIALEKALRVPT